MGLSQVKLPVGDVAIQLGLSKVKLPVGDVSILLSSCKYGTISISIIAIDMFGDTMVPVPVPQSIGTDFDMN